MSRVIISPPHSSQSLFLVDGRLLPITDISQLAEALEPIVWGLLTVPAYIVSMMIFLILINNATPIFTIILHSSGSTVQVNRSGTSRKKLDI